MLRPYPLKCTVFLLLLKLAMDPRRKLRRRFGTNVQAFLVLRPIFLRYLFGKS